MEIMGTKDFSGDDNLLSQIILVIANIIKHVNGNNKNNTNNNNCYAIVVDVDDGM